MIGRRGVISEGALVKVSYSAWYVEWLQGYDKWTPDLKKRQGSIFLVNMMGRSFHVIGDVSLD